jgi:hypothetical protein
LQGFAARAASTRAALEPMVAPAVAELLLEQPL